MHFADKHRAASPQTQWQGRPHRRKRKQPQITANMPARTSTGKSEGSQSANSRPQYRHLVLSPASASGQNTSLHFQRPHFFHCVRRMRAHAMVPVTLSLGAPSGYWARAQSETPTIAAKNSMCKRLDTALTPPPPCVHTSVEDARGAATWHRPRPRNNLPAPRLVQPRAM